MKLYRYLNISRGLQALEKGKLHLSTIDRYNDPFELLPQAKSIDLIVAALKEENMPDIMKTETGKQLAKEFEKDGLIDDATALITTGALALVSPLVAFSLYGLYALLSRGDQTPESIRLGLFLRRFLPFLKDCKCCCFSEVKDNILLWSHYTGGHKGIAIHFSDNLDYWRSIQFKKMNYSYFRSELPNKDTNFNDYVWDLLTTKARCWRYEKEVRLICMDKNRRTVNIHPESVKEILVGAKCAPDDILNVLNIRNEKYPHAKVLQAKVSNDEYELIFEEI